MDAKTINLKGMFFLIPLIAGVMFGTGGVFVRTLMGYGMSNVTVLFLRVFIAAIILLLFLLIYNKSFLKIKIKDLPIFIGTGILGMMSLNLCFNAAIKTLSLSLATVLLSTAPVFVVILAGIFFKEKITSKKVVCMLIVIVGCVFASGLVDAPAGAIGSLAGIFIGVGSAFFYSLYSIFSRVATNRGYHTYTVIFYSVLLISIVLAPFVDWQLIGSFVVEAPVKNVLFLILHSLCASVVPYVCITMSLLYMEAGKVSILASGGEPATAVLWGIVFYREIPTVLILVGIVITVIGLAALCLNNGKKLEMEEA